jgi:hypothetical protein
MMTYDVEMDHLMVRQYWRLPIYTQTNNTDAGELVSRFQELLRDSVRLRLIADVPVGILLSGGIDSSLVTAMAVEVASKPVKTFTISFPGHDKYDESPYARLVASHFGTDHTELEAEPTSIEVLSDLAKQYDESIADSSMVPDNFRAGLCERKILPCRLAKSLLPKQLDLKRKQGFTMPLHQWFKGSWGTYFEQVLREADSNLFDQTVIRQLIDYQHRGFLNSQRLFTLVIFELWRRNYEIRYS